jgi:hypothetical protein
MANPEELSLPSEIGKATEAAEVLRAWIVDSRLVCVLDPQAFEDPAIWGMLLADVARHVGQAYEQLQGADPEAVSRAIAQSFAAELAKPTDDHHGSLE